MDLNKISIFASARSEFQIIPMEVVLPHNSNTTLQAYMYIHLVKTITETNNKYTGMFNLFCSRCKSKDIVINVLFAALGVLKVYKKY